MKNAEAKAWLNSLHAISSIRCRALMDKGERFMREITPEAIGDKVRFFGCTAIGEIVDIDHDTGESYIEFGDGETVVADFNQFDVVRGKALPDCDYMYAFTSRSDEKWAENGGLEKMSELGFRIYEADVYDWRSEGWTYAFGIDGGLTEKLTEKLYALRTKMQNETKKSA